MEETTTKKELKIVNFIMNKDEFNETKKIYITKTKFGQKVSIITSKGNFLIGFNLVHFDGNTLQFGINTSKEVDTFTLSEQQEDKTYKQTKISSAELIDLLIEDGFKLAPKLSKSEYFEKLKLKE